MRIRTPPGEVLKKGFVIPIGLGANALSRALDAPPNRITGIFAAQNPHAVTPDTALRLACCFGTTSAFWLNPPEAYDLSVARDESGAHIADVVRPPAA